MSTSKLKYEKEEFVRRGQEIYESRVREQVEKGNRGKIVAIDIETGAFEVAEDSLSAAEKLQVRCPEAQAWFVRIGHRAVHKVGYAGSNEVQ